MGPLRGLAIGFDLLVVSGNERRKGGCGDKNNDVRSHGDKLVAPR